MINEKSDKDVINDAIERFALQHPELRRGTVVSEIPAPLKWAGAIVAGLFTGGVATLCFWLVTSVSEMQVTLGRLDERMVAFINSKESVDAEQNRQIQELQEYHRTYKAKI